MPGHHLLRPECGARGDYTFRVRAIDAVGNQSAPATSSYALDTVGPGVTITSSPASPDDVRNPTWSFTTEAGATVSCSLTGGGTTVVAWSSCVSPAAFDLNGKPDGGYTLRVRSTDVAGNIGPEATSTYVLDTVVPGSGDEDKDDDGKDGGGNDDRDQPVPVDPGVPSELTDPVTVLEDTEGDVAVPAGDDKEPRDRDRPDSADRAEEEESPVAPTPEEARESAQALPSAPGVISEILDGVSAVVAGLLEQPGFPLGLIALVGGFLMLQNKIDRKDPKLALAPVYPDPHLYFEVQEGPGKDR